MYIRLLTKALSVFFVLVIAQNTFAAKKASNPAQEDQLVQLVNSMEKSIEGELVNIEKLKNEIAHIKNTRKHRISESNAYKVQFTTFSNLLFLPSAQIRTLENAQTTVLASLSSINEQIKTLQEDKKIWLQKYNDAETQLSTLKEQRKASQAVKANWKLKNRISLKSRKLQNLVSQKKRIIKKIQWENGRQIKDMEKLLDSFSILAGDYKNTLESQKSRYLLDRDPNLFSDNLSDYFEELTTGFWVQLQQLEKPVFWNNQIYFIKNLNLNKVLFFAFFLLVTLFFSQKVNKYLKKIEQSIVSREDSKVLLVIKLLNKNIFLLGLAVFLYGYILSGSFLQVSAFLSTLMEVILVWLITGWFLAAIKHSFILKNTLPLKYKRKLSIILLAVRWYFTFSIILSWVFQYNKGLVFLLRLWYELSFLIFCSYFWKNFFVELNTEKARKVLWHSIYLGSYAIVISGIIMEMSGYGSLSNFWFLSWGRTFTVLLWFYLTISSLYELKNSAENKDEDTKTEIGLVAGNHFRWLIVRILQLVIPIVFIFTLLLAWGAKKIVFTNAYSILVYNFQIGSISFSLLSIINAILVVLATQLIVGLWRNAFYNKFLNQSQLEPGLQDSITTISVYIIWTIGILFSMNVLGLNPTSLMVVFGALGIGLGFGLQNIFNNFMSGIILLFERPIQVGDDIEIDGDWATVKKINVRSTILQSYDNATLIIPNSNLINNQVRNWSFKDKRLRRQVTIGVAYGSDINLVKRLLLEIANSKSKVLKKPEPDVIFSDFADSSLVFTLRFWTYVKHIVSLESDIRFEIDDLFAKNKITIAYPQCDVHLDVVN